MPESPSESQDGHGAADNDKPYRYGQRPRASCTFPFSALEYGRLLRLRGRIEDGLAGQGDLAAEPSLD